jgi:trehalose 6-phosphate synthase/phosphatase
VSIENRVIVVSNRLPFTLKRSADSWKVERSSGGLVTAMRPILKRTQGIWIGWPGESPSNVDEDRLKLLNRMAEKERYIAVDLPKEVSRGFYEGFANQSLWPIFHHFPGFARFDPDHWQSYREANLKFRDAILNHLQPNDVVWIHDYQLMLLPRMLREVAPDTPIGFFLHIPFPSSGIFRVLPRRDELLRGILGADYIAFHTYSYLQNFRSSILRILGLESQMNVVFPENRPVRIDALPIGISPKDFTDLLHNDNTTAKRLREIKERFTGRRILLSVDRMDYTKGIPERLRTFNRLLHRNPDLRGNIVLIQVAVPSREKIDEYRELRHEVDELIGKINGEWSTPDWTPVVYLRRAIPQSELIALYAAADLAWVSPLRDGLNLVAKEYVACKENGDGTLVLSEFAGAAAEMGESILVNPYDEERTAEAIERALSFSKEEQRDRMLALHRRVVRNNVFTWGDRFISNLLEASASRNSVYGNGPLELPSDTALESFRKARSRMLLLDYDGTLVGYRKRPQDAVPPTEVVELLRRLCADSANTVAIVSGRSRENIEGWFSSVQGLWLAAEHGATIRRADSRNWETFQKDHFAGWKDHVYPILEHFVDRTPGSFIEDKEFSLVWHYRMADPEFGEWLANELVANLEQMLAETELRPYRGQKTIEIKPLWANKGEVFARLKEACPEPEFILAAGDDRTDEDLFAQLPETAWTVHIGNNRTRARYFLSGPLEMISFLSQCAEAYVT